MSLRGIRPSPEELDRVRADPEAIAEIVASYVESDAFGLTIRDMHAEIYLLRRDTFNILPALGELEGYDLQDIYRSQVEEPLRLVEHIVMNDRPYTEIVTADYMLTNDVVAKMYGLPYDFESPEEWQRSYWPDARPRAGLLSSAELLRRWESDGSNFNRGRANMVADKLLCEAFATRDITLPPGGIDIADEFAVSDAAENVEACAACHQSLDPLAAYFWGYMQLIHRNAVRDAIQGDCRPWDYSLGEPEYGPNHVPEYFCYPIKQYSVFMENEWEYWKLRAPNYFGTPARDLSEVGVRIADDPRFANCAARQFFGYLAQVPPGEVPFERAAELQLAFEASGFDAKELARAVVLSDEFRAFATAEAQSPVDPVIGLKTVRPEQYARMVEDLTGYRWMALADRAACADSINGTECWGPVDLSTTDLFGFLSMQGGIDAINITRPTHTLTPTKVLVVDQLARDAAMYAVSRDFEVAVPQRRLLGLVEPSTTEEGAIREQLWSLHLRILGVEADDAAIEAAAGGGGVGSGGGARHPPPAAPGSAGPALLMGDS